MIRPKKADDSGTGGTNVFHLLIENAKRTITVGQGTQRANRVEPGKDGCPGGGRHIPRRGQKHRTEEYERNERERHSRHTLVRHRPCEARKPACDEPHECAVIHIKPKERDSRSRKSPYPDAGPDEPGMEKV